MWRTPGRRRTWFIAGAILGLFVTRGLNAYDIRGPGLHPSFIFLFDPLGYFVMGAGLGVGLLYLALTMLLYGGLAALLRRGTFVLIAVLLLVVWLSHPPPDSARKQQFARHRAQLEEIVEMFIEDSHLWMVGPTVAYRTHDAPADGPPLSAERWDAYRRLLEQAGLSQGVYRYGTGKIFLVSRTPLASAEPHGPGEAHPFATYYGFVYCLAELQAPVGACGRWRAGRGPYDRWERLDEHWYLYDLYITLRVEN